MRFIDAWRFMLLALVVCVFVDAAHRTHIAWQKRSVLGWLRDYPECPGQALYGGALWPLAEMNV
jgi:hypothetical protein